MYMSYCRFEGTKAELASCLYDVQDHIDETAESEISENEISNFRLMVENFVCFLNDNDLLDEYGNLNQDQLDQICEAMRKSYGMEDEEW